MTAMNQGAQRPGPRRFRTFRAVAALMLREMESTYGRSPGGYLWAFLEPIAGIALLSFVFSLIVRAPSLGTNFALFYATGLLPFLLYMTVSNQIATAIRYSQALLAYPAVTFVDALLARLILNTLTYLVVSVVILSGLILAFDLRPILDWGAILTAAAMAVSLALAVGALNCYLFSAFPVWERLWGILNRPMFILAGVLFIPEDVPARFRELYMLNPLAHMTAEMRKGFYSTYDAVHVSPLYVFLFALCLGTLGLLLLLRNHKEIVLK